MLSARVAQNIAVFLIVFLAGLLILTQVVYSDSDSGVTDDIIWSLAVGALSHQYSETYSSHNYSIQLDIDMVTGVYASYEFAHFVHDLTKKKVVRTVKVPPEGEVATGPTLYDAHEEDYHSQGLGASVYGLPPENDYKIEAYTRLEIYKGAKRVKEPGDALRKVTEEKMIDIE